MFTPFKPTHLIVCILLPMLLVLSSIVEKMFAWSATLSLLQPRYLPLAGAPDAALSTMDH